MISLFVLNLKVPESIVNDIMLPCYHHDYLVFEDVSTFCGYYNETKSLFRFE